MMVAAAAAAAVLVDAVFVAFGADSVVAAELWTPACAADFGGDGGDVPASALGTLGGMLVWKGLVPCSNRHLSDAQIARANTVDPMRLHPHLTDCRLA